MLGILLEENIIDEKKFQIVLQQIKNNNSNLGFNRVIDDTE